MDYHGLLLQLFSVLLMSTGSAILDDIKMDGPGRSLIFYNHSDKVKTIHVLLNDCEVNTMKHDQPKYHPMRKYEKMTRKKFEKI